MAHEGSSPYSQQPTTCPYPEPDSLIPRLLVIFHNMINFYSEELLELRPTPTLEVRPLSAVRDCLFNIFATILHIWRTFLHLQPKDAPCRGDRDPSIRGPRLIASQNKRTATTVTNKNHLTRQQNQFLQRLRHTTYDHQDNFQKLLGTWDLRLWHRQLWRGKLTVFQHVQDDRWYGATFRQTVLSSTSRVGLQCCMVACKVQDYYSRNPCPWRHLPATTKQNVILQ
jgi:hypothetical protein